MATCKSALPAIGLCQPYGQIACGPSVERTSSARLDASVRGSGHPTHRPQAARRPACANRSRRANPPCASHSHADRLPASTASHPAFVTIAKRPLCGTRQRQFIEVIWAGAERINFLLWTRQSRSHPKSSPSGSGFSCTTSFVVATESKNSTRRANHLMAARASLVVPDAVQRPLRCGACHRRAFARPVGRAGTS